MTLGFSVDELLPKARGGGQLKLGLASLSEDEWLQPTPDISARRTGFAAHRDGIQLSPEPEEPGREMAQMLGITGALPETGAILFTIGVYVALLGHLLHSNTSLIATTMKSLLIGEGNRRGTPHYAAVLTGFAEQLDRSQR